MPAPDSLLLSWADLLLLAVLGVSVIVGALRGFVFEALSLGAWVIAYFATPFLRPLAEGWLPPADHPGDWQALAAPVLAFVAVLLLVSLLARLLRALIHATPLQAPDRLLGSGFGLLRGLLLCLLIGVLVGFTPLREHPAWTQSQARPLIGSSLRALGPLLPQDLHRLLDPVIERTESV